MNIGTAIFCMLVCIGLFIFGLYCGIGILMGDKGSIIARIICGIGVFALFGGGGGIGGMIASIDGLKDSIEELRKEKEQEDTKKKV